MLKKFEMTDLGLMTYFLGLELKQQTSEIFISQEKYANKILKKFQWKAASLKKHLCRLE